MFTNASSQEKRRRRGTKKMSAVNARAVMEGDHTKLRKPPVDGGLFRKKPRKKTKKTSLVWTSRHNHQKRGAWHWVFKVGGVG